MKKNNIKKYTAMGVLAISIMCSGVNLVNAQGSDGIINVDSIGSELTEEQKEEIRGLEHIEYSTNEKKSMFEKAESITNSKYQGSVWSNIGVMHKFHSEERNADDYYSNLYLESLIIGDFASKNGLLFTGNVSNENNTRLFEFNDEKGKKEVYSMNDIINWIYCSPTFHRDENGNTYYFAPEGYSLTDEGVCVKNKYVRTLK